MTIDQDESSVEVLVDRLTAGDLAGAIACCLTFRQAAAATDRPTYPAIVLPAIRRMETMWQADALSFDKVLSGFWLTRSLIERLTLIEGLSQTREPTQSTYIVGLAAGEEHCFGAQMLADELRSRGGSVTLELTGEPRHMIELVTAEPFDAVFLSVNHDAALVGLADLIEDLRISSCNPRLKIMVGGSIFTGSDKSYDFLGSDGIGRTFTDAMAWVSTGATRTESARH